MSAGISSLACYSLFEASLTGLFAFFGNQWLRTDDGHWHEVTPGSGRQSKVPYRQR